jgi:hypothetical protein
MNIDNPIIQQFITDHFADYSPSKYKLKITEKDDMIVVTYTNTKYNLTNTCYIAV